MDNFVKINKNFVNNEKNRYLEKNCYEQMFPPTNLLTKMQEILFSKG